MQPLFVKQAHGLFAQPRCKACDLQRLVPCRLGGREHHAVNRHEAVEIVQNAVTLDQHLTVIQHQGRHAGEGVIGPDFLRIAKHRPWPVPERQLVQSQRNANSAHERGIILANQNHELCSKDKGRNGHAMEEHSKPPQKACMELKYIIGIDSSN